MSVQELKENIHAIIDEMNDEVELQKYYDSISNKVVNKEDWATLNLEQQNEILEIVELCNDEANLIPNEVVMAKLEKWITK